MKKLIYTIIFGLSAFNFSAQQDALYSQYMFNPLAINPAYAGSRESISGVMLYRSQWVGMDGAPNTGTFTIHSPIKGKNFALGFSMAGEKIGPTKNANAALTYAYRLRLGKGKLSFGLRGGMYSSRLDGTLLNFNNTGDSHNTGAQLKAVAPNFDFGTYYYTNKFYVGASVSHLLSEQLKYDNPNNVNLQLVQHFMVTAGYAWEINDRLVLKPSTLIKVAEGAPMNIDLNVSALFNKVFWLGASYRSSGSMIFITEYNITDFLRLGYSYDMSIGQLRKYNSGSHELFIGTDFTIGGKKVVSPRYM